MKDETLYRKRVIDEWPGFVTRIEPSASSSFGVPDVNLSLAGRETWVEFKFLEDDQTFSLRRTQRLWIMKRIEAGMNNALVCVMNPSGCTFLAGADCLDLSPMRLRAFPCSRRYDLTWASPMLGRLPEVFGFILGG